MVSRLGDGPPEGRQVSEWRFTTCLVLVLGQGALGDGTPGAVRASAKARRIREIADCDIPVAAAIQQVDR
jgi:hypothetical protein